MSTRLPEQLYGFTASEMEKAVALFPGLPVHKSDSPRRALRICVLSPEISGPDRNGGIGSTYRNLAGVLAADGHQVTVLHVPHKQSDPQSLAKWRRDFAVRGIRYVSPAPAQTERFIGTGEMIRSWLAYQWLKEQDFDIIHSPEWLGLPFYSLLAKHQGLSFQNTLWRVGIHSPSSWIRTTNKQHLDQYEQLVVDFMERRSVELADVVVSCAQFILRWVADNGWNLPAKSFVYPNIVRLPESLSEDSLLASGERKQINEIVFFGRLETRKGIGLFCDAIDRLCGKAPATTRITFLGRAADVDGLDAAAYVNSRATKWPFPCEVIDSLDQPKALNYLCGQGRLAVIPSLSEVLSHAVAECLFARIPFLTSKVGGTPELISPADLETITFPPEPDVLAGRLLTALREGVGTASPANDRQVVEKSWLSWHQNVDLPDNKTLVEPKVSCTAAPLVSVCLVHHNRPRLLQQALASIEAQDYPNLEVVLVDDGSSSPDAIALLKELEPLFVSRGWQLVRQNNLYLGASRNTAARHARGKYLLFMDDDNYAGPNEVSTFVSVAEKTGADILTCQINMFEGDNPPPVNQRSQLTRLLLGNVPLIGISHNLIGDANSLLKSDAFWKLGGFTEDFGVCHEDWELLARACLQGLRVECVPQSLFWYRTSPSSMSSTTDKYSNYKRGVRPYREVMPQELAHLPLYAQGLQLRTERFETLLERLVEENAVACNKLSDALKTEHISAYNQLNSLRATIDGIWSSKSWTLLAPVRNFLRRLRGIAPESKPEVSDMANALAAVNNLSSSFSWNLTGPLRALLAIKRSLLACRMQNIADCAMTEIVPQAEDKVNQALALSLLQEKTRDGITAGPFQGMQYASRSVGSVLYPKLLGTYELELHDLINEFCQEQFDLIVNIGAGEGYYAVGMAMRCPTAKIVAAESEGENRQLLAQLAERNGVAERISLLGHCDTSILAQLLREQIGRHILIIMDVAGYEIKLLNPASIPELEKCTILVQVHDGKDTGPIGNELVARLGATHNITRTWSRLRTADDLPVHHPTIDEQLLTYLDEGRQYGLSWLSMRPRDGVQDRKGVYELVETKGIKIPIIDYMSPAVRKAIREQGYETDELKLVDTEIKPDDVVMELGTGIGLISAYCAKKVGSERVFSYEANPELEPHIKAVYNLNQVNPTLTMCMLGREIGQSRFYLGEDFWGSSTIRRAPGNREIIVPVKPFNDELRQINPSVLIIDIEGGEYDLFMHARFEGVRIIIFEMHTDLIGQEKDLAIRERLRKSGFRINESRSVIQSQFRSILVWERSGDTGFRGKR